MRVRLTGCVSNDEPRLVNRPGLVLAEQLDEHGQAALFIAAEMVVYVPAEIILAEIVIILRPVADDVIERVQAKMFRLTNLASQARVGDTAAERPDGINKRRLRQLVPGFAQVPDLVLMRPARE